MDLIIKKANFLHNDCETREKFDDETEEWWSSHSEECRVDDALKALSVLREKLAKAPFPDIDTEGWDQAINAFEVCNRIITNLIDEGKITTASIHSEYFNFVVCLMEGGLGTIHMKIVTKCMNDSTIELEAYIQSLEKDGLKRMIEALTKDTKPKEKIEAEKFFDTYDYFLILFLNDVLSEQQKQDFKDTLLDHFIHLSLDFTHLEEPVYKTVAEAADRIYSAYEDPWQTYEDVARLKSIIKHCGEPFKNPQFPQHDRAENFVQRDVISKLSVQLGKRSAPEEFYQEIIDLAVTIGSSGNNNEEFLLRSFNYALSYFHEIPPKALSKNPKLFSEAAKKYKHAIEVLNLHFLAKDRFPVTFIENFLIKVYEKDKESAKQLVELLIPLLSRPCLNTLRACREILEVNDLAAKWKEYPDTTRKIFDAISTVKFPESFEEEGDEKSFADHLIYISREFFEGLKRCKMLKQYSENMLDLSMSLIEKQKDYLYELAEEIAEKIEISPKEHKQAAVAIMRRVLVIVKDEDFPWNTNSKLRDAVQDVIRACTGSFKDGKIFTTDELKVYISVVVTCLQYEAVCPEDGVSLSNHYLLFLETMDKLSEWLMAVNRFDLGAEIVPSMMKTFEEDSEHLYIANVRFLTEFTQATSGQKILAAYVEDLIGLYVDKEQTDLLRLVDAVYPFNVKPMKKHYKALFNTFVETGDMQVVMWLGQIFHKVSKKQPELFTEEDAGKLVEKAKEDMSNQPTLLQIIQELCKRRPEIMTKHIDDLLDKTTWNPMLLSWMNDMLCSVALHEKKCAPKVQEYLLDSVRTNQDKANLLTGLNAIRMIGFKYPDILKPKRAEIEKLQIADPDGQSLKQTILDMIDGKTSESLRKQLEEQQQDLSGLVGRVEETEEAVVGIKGELGRQGEELQNVKSEVNAHGERLDQVEETVEDTVQKVEEIDQKTLSHAPFWSRDVSKLLNSQSEHDWRLLASRLGYSNDDIRGWAQQTDPCMALLNEWYATRKTSEATYAVLTQLQEMNRMDAAIIVENAMKNAEAVVEDEDFEYASPPPIFISYQWAHQPEVKLLKQHLEMAGYESWLDIGQMGGGDKLFEKIDTGIRAAKVVVSCVTDKYAKSPNCNREVNLSASLNKPIIPLLIEKCTWPPPGSMGPLFSEYLFIRFFQRSGEELSDERYWPDSKFQELLMQLNTLGLPPTQGKIEPIYRNWWMPVVEEIKIDKSKTKNGGKMSSTEQVEDTKKAAESPDVFISYQWGKQKNIIKLYERLCSLGYTCWLDIKQMGGGDSLFEKIDKGIRGCRVMVSCITEKYALSANCRREITLADALQKPMIPLKLEDMSWPPHGPMSMILGRLIYIDFTKDETQQMTWDGPEFDMLLAKINEHVHLTEENLRGEKKQNDEMSKEKLMKQNNDKLLDKKVIISGREQDNAGQLNKCDKNEERNMGKQKRAEPNFKETRGKGRSETEDSAYRQNEESKDLKQNEKDRGRSESDLKEKLNEGVKQNEGQMKYETLRNSESTLGEPQRREKAKNNSTMSSKEERQQHVIHNKVDDYYGEEEKPPTSKEGAQKETSLHKDEASLKAAAPSHKTTGGSATQRKSGVPAKRALSKWPTQSEANQCPKPPPSQQAKDPHYKPFPHNLRNVLVNQSPDKKSHSQTELHAQENLKMSSSSLQFSTRKSTKPPPSQQQSHGSVDRVPSQAFKTDQRIRPHVAPSRTEAAVSNKKDQKEKVSSTTSKDIEQPNKLPTEQEVQPNQPPSSPKKQEVPRQQKPQKSSSCTII